MYKGDPQAAKEQPDDVEEKKEAAGRGSGGNHLPAERPQGKNAQFEALQAKGDADNGQAQQKAPDKIAKRGTEPAEKEPDQVADGIHEPLVFGAGQEIIASFPLER